MDNRETNRRDTPAWDRLAQLLGSEEGTEIAMLMRQNGLLRTSSGEPISRSDPETVSGPRAIGPWKPSQHEGSVQFVRDSDWDRYLWLEERDILLAEKPHDVLRVCVVGESVAAGMFFAPSISPSKVLNSVLTQVIPADMNRVEVIDLSRNAMRLELLLEMVDTVTQLNPDVIVVFAGNNFCRDHSVGRPDLDIAPIDYVRVANAKGPTALTKEFLRQLSLAADTAVDTVSQSAQARDAKLVWMIPATCSNWQRIAPPMWLGDGRSRDWHNLFRAAKKALQRQDYGKLLEYGQAMEKLDRATCPTTQRLLAVALTGLDRLQEAQKHHVREVDADAAVHRATFLAPGIQTVVKDAISKGGDRLGFHVVDLAQVIATNDELRTRCFVDYCHLSLEGMQIAVTAATEAILDAVDPDASVGRRHRLGEISAIKADAMTQQQCPSHEQVEARGLFEAAIYNSHLQHGLFPEQDGCELRKRLEHAIGLWPELSEVMKDYVRMRHGASATEISASSHRLVDGANSLLDYAILQWIHGVDPQTIEVICQVLEQAGHGGNDLLEWYQRYDAQQLAGGIDLTEPRYLANFPRDGVVDWDAERGTRVTQPFLRSHWQDLSLTFAAQQGSELECRMIARLPRYCESERVDKFSISINGQAIKTVPVSTQWTRSGFRIDGALVKNGFNVVTIDWPELGQDERAAIDSAIRRYQQFGCADWFPIFGEIHALHVRATRANGDKAETDKVVATRMAKIEVEP